VIRYAGVDCLLEDPDGILAEFLKRTELDHLDLFGAPPAITESRNHSLSHAQPATPLPVPNYPVPPKVRLNQLYWPTGATRWAHCIVLVDQEKLDEIYTAIGATADTDAPSGYARRLTPQQLAIGDSDFLDALPTDDDAVDGAAHSVISTGMYPLDARPVSLPTGSSLPSLWLLPLVDERYFWQWMTLPPRADQVLGAGETEENILQTWDGWRRVIEDVILAVDRTRSLDWVSAEPSVEFFQPDITSLWRPQHNIAVILDAFAHSCGRRFVRQYDQKLELIDADESLSRHTANAISHNTFAGGMILTPPIAGATVTTGKTAADFANATVVPEFVDVVFRKVGETDPDGLTTSRIDGPAPYTHLEELHGIGTRTVRASTIPIGAENVVSTTGKVIYTPTWIGEKFYDVAGAAGSNDSAYLGDRYFRMADILAQDVVKWAQQRHEYDLAHFGIWPLSGYDDFVTWRPNRGGTHVRSMPYNFGVDTMLIQAHTQTDFDPDFQEGYLLETLEAATVSGSVLSPKMARMAVFTLFADYDSDAGADARHDPANWVFSWVRTGQLVVCSTSEDLEGDTDFPISARRIGQTWRPTFVGCESTALDIGAIV
jgi:hypothetical protein